MNHGVSTNEFRGCGLFDGKSKCLMSFELIVEIERSLRYMHSYLNRSTANRKELQTVRRVFGR